MNLEEAPGYLDVVKHPLGEDSDVRVLCLMCGVCSRLAGGRKLMNPFVVLSVPHLDLTRPCCPSGMDAPKTIRAGAGEKILLYRTRYLLVAFACTNAPSLLCAGLLSCSLEGDCLHL